MHSVRRVSTQKIPFSFDWQRCEQSGLTSHFRQRVHHAECPRNRYFDTACSISFVKTSRIGNTTTTRKFRQSHTGVTTDKVLCRRRLGTASDGLSFPSHWRTALVKAAFEIREVCLRVRRFGPVFEFAPVTVTFPGGVESPAPLYAVSRAFLLRRSCRGLGRCRQNGPAGKKKDNPLRITAGEKTVQKTRSANFIRLSARE